MNSIHFMEEAISWAAKCNPIKSSIPKVGAIIEAKGAAIGRGRRGTGQEGDDRHAEWNAIDQVEDKSLLPEATLYTTLEPCTPDVRSNPQECCTDLILQHQFRKVVVGILDPNQGVTGKGLYRLQDHGIEVELFPHDLAKKIRALNAGFTRSQQAFGVTILSPSNGATLETFKSGGRYTVRFKCRNQPTRSNYLLCVRNGHYWPQSGPFRHVEKDVWEIDAHFGSYGHHTLQLVTASDLGVAVIEYYRRVVSSNSERRSRLKTKLASADLPLLGSDYLGIQMNGLPKGIRLEASVEVTIASPPE